jgi:hypothetical protein
LTLAFTPAGQTGAGGNSVSLGATTADAQGRVHFVTIVPRAATPGVWNIAASEEGSQQTVTTPFTVLAPEVVSAATGEGNMPTGTSAPADVPTDVPVPPTDTSVPTPTSAPTDTPVPPMPTDTPPPTVAPTDAPVPPTEVPLPPSVTPHPKRPWLDARYQGNRLLLHGARYATGNKVYISLASDKEGNNPVPIGEAIVDGRGAFDFTAKLSKELRKNRFVIAEDPIQGRRAIWYIEIKKGNGND